MTMVSGTAQGLRQGHTAWHPPFPTTSVQAKEGLETLFTLTAGQSVCQWMKRTHCTDPVTPQGGATSPPTVLPQGLCDGQQVLGRGRL